MTGATPQDEDGASAATAHSPSAADKTVAPAHPHPAAAGEGGHVKAGKWGLIIGAIGVVFGDIGTSPLYALREAIGHAREGVGGDLAVIGVVSLAFWALMTCAVAWLLVQLWPFPVAQAGILLLYGALPPAVINYLFAEQYRQDPELVAAIVVAGTLLSLLFVPAGVGVMVYVGLIQAQWLPIALTLLASTLLTVMREQS
jgi:putative effector of murein hydrolase LrgA (UPF0299 family)